MAPGKIGECASEEEEEVARVGRLLGKSQPVI